jgi:hypothetical protein
VLAAGGQVEVASWRVSIRRPRKLGRLLDRRVVARCPAQTHRPVRHLVRLFRAMSCSTPSLQ